MNKLYKTGACLAILAMVAACNKYKAAEFNVDKPESVTIQEDLDSYPALRTYINHNAHPDFKMGVAG